MLLVCIQAVAAWADRLFSSTPTSTSIDRIVESVCGLGNTRTRTWDNMFCVLFLVLGS